MFFDIKIAMWTCSLCRNKALWFLSHCKLWDKDIKLTCTRDLCLVSARIVCCDRSFEMPLSHKTFFSSYSEDTESLLVIQTKYHRSFLFTFPSFWVVFLSHFSLPDTILFFLTSAEASYLSVTNVFGHHASLCQKIMKWSCPVRNTTFTIFFAPEWTGSFSHVVQV